ncbi:MAG: PHP domain-containing protein [Ruminococcaceae bacterium]|nr:PHP domain-containing protein [Oscillospiraceae bacterium]
MMKYELHSHTAETSQCANITAQELVEKYKELGYSGIVITNHYSDFTFSLKEMFNKKLRSEHYLAGYREAKKYETEDFSVFLGIELRFFLNGNDYLIFGVTEELVEKMPFLLPMYLKRTSKFFKKNGCILIQAHPFRPYIYRANPKYLDGVEIINGKSSKEENKKALKWAEKKSLKIRTAGSDCHRESGAGISGIITNEPIKTNDDLLRILKNGEFEIIEKNYEK